LQIRDLPVSGLFFGIGHEPATKFLAGQLALDEDGYVVRLFLRRCHDLQPIVATPRIWDATCAFQEMQEKPRGVSAGIAREPESCNVLSQNPCSGAGYGAGDDHDQRAGRVCRRRRAGQEVAASDHRRRLRRASAGVAGALATVGRLLSARLVEHQHLSNMAYVAKHGMLAYQVAVQCTVLQMWLVRRLQMHVQDHG